MADSSPLVLGIAGFGTVGSGLVRILAENRAEILARTGRDIVIRKVLVRDASRQRACALPEGAALTTSLDDLVNDPAINVVVELIGGVDKPRELILKALSAGKNVVTANKALLAESGNELFALAAEKGLHLGYEASVCGGIPVVQTLRESLAGNRLEGLMGILNGTSNYILSEMSTKGLDFSVALKQAQELGYAEADPTLDIEGFDAAHKLALLIRLAWGVDYPYAQLPVRGISQVRPEDINYAREFGYRIKLVAHARLVGQSPAEGGGIEAEVCPTLVHQTYLMARVGGAYNAVRLEGNAVGSIFLHGKGAGDLPTGSAVASDILAIARNACPNNTGFARPHLPVPAKVIPQAESRSHYYIRMKVTDKPGVLRDIAAIMAENDISIAQVIQKDSDTGDAPCACASSHVPFIIMTHEASTAGVHKALRTLAASPLLHEPPVHYRVMVKKN
ncbi:MAG: homoserine dehydrogenase [Desulfovibrionaceae bacterium]|nr:homoserine dehydrogenase [Desulfovibrionaceae bacterium]